MLFIAILTIAAFALASVSGLFSVWGLATTYGGVFWYVVAMGSALELSKLVGTSYIYRFWNKGMIWLKLLMSALVFVLMCITAFGHYGFLTSGYQQDVLPLKQQTEQVNLLQQEKDAKQARKAALDEQISSLAAETSSAKDRTRMINQFKKEQADTTARVNELDAEILAAKQKLLQTETHVGNIVYISQVFNVSTDVAIKWLTLVLVCVFDPTAVALILALNHAISVRANEKAELALQEANTHANEAVGGTPSALPTEYVEDRAEESNNSEEIQVGIKIPEELSLVEQDEPPIPTAEEVEQQVVDMEQPSLASSLPLPEEVVSEEAKISNPDPAELAAALKAHALKPSKYEHVENFENKIGEILDYRGSLLAKQRRGERLTAEEAQDLQAINRLLIRHGYAAYV